MTPRVVVLTPYFHPVIGGVESNAARFARFLVAAGVPTQVLTKRITTSLPDVEVQDGVPVRRLGPFGERSASGKWRMMPAVFSWLVRHRSDYDVVAVIDYRGVGIAAIAARAITGRPVLVQGQTTGVLSGSIGGSVADEGVGRRLLKWPLRAVYARADAVACISRVLQDEARAFGVPESRIHLLPNAIDMTRFAPAAAHRTARRAALGLSPDDVVCVFVGRLSREKGILELLEAWKILQPLPRSRLLVAGPDMTGSPWDAGADARALVISAALESTVRFLGPTDDPASLLQLADIAVQPSHFEALGLSAVEALACGVPVVASRVGGLPDFIEDGRNGRLVPPKDPAALASALRDLIEDGARRSLLASAARTSVADYDERIVFHRMQLVLSELSDARRG
jgi:glycosyltransferase involved in cell wall biosynthesis